jgi:hypothetical protein
MLSDEADARDDDWAAELADLEDRAVVEGYPATLPL